MGVAAAAAVAGAVGSVAGAAGTLMGGKQGAGGAQQSQYLQAMEMNQNIVNTQPFIQAGHWGANTLQNQLASGQIGTPMDLSGMPQFSWNPTQAGLEATPGYQFTLQQGLQATQNAAAARGLGVSGAALKGADTFTTGLANQTYNQQLQNALGVYNAQMGGFQNQFQDYWANQQNRYNQLSNLASLGGNVAVGQGSVGTQGAANVGNAAATAGQLQGAATTGAANTLGNALSSPQTANALNALFGGGGSTISPATDVANANYENAQFAQNPAGTYGPFQ
jgi:hypothetical protein